jgi:DNA-binding Lrp family transcriptional regulator
VASAVPVPKTTLVVNPRDYKTMILEALFHIYLNTGKLEECLKVATELNNILPSDISRQRVQEIEDVKRRNDVAHWVVKLAMHLNQTGQKEELEKLVDAIPREIASEPVLVNLRNEFSPIREWKEDEIVIYCGPGFEQWSPKSVAKGIGGSEEAVIYLTRELAKLGWKVTVYADPREDEGYFDGVLYLPYYKINWKDHFNILVSWRQIGLFDVSITAKKTYLWNHDIQNPLTYTKERVNKITKAMFLSKWHRANVPELDESKVMYSANGVVI